MNFGYFVVPLTLFLLIAIQFASMASPKLLSLEFEVYGRVQGVFFRKYTQKQGKELGLRGWCMNTPKGTVLGQLEGEVQQVEKMKSWLQKTGSPKSRIDKVDFKFEKPISDFTFIDFSVRR
ncbi:acylphosphatase-2-like isoform X6 [Frankliniella occidentalis]|uniref:Acylphosphatase n=1 Tax=Frankliniella occidentalis TaxID=133901 RepID=A0A6J1THV6_FRAOC|nr:acylphosphatase-2-like isoform X5 [Frankliniella occidentalis]XP_052120676.1 acylphosphatase-2-like isoform X4 [Frankliniella occidentalis]XP_052120677.1 acylphosphatase-2-like isoform X6 [Frankliniella occidentalis]